MSRDHVFLSGIGSARMDVAILENSGAVAEYEIHRTGDEAVDVELAVGVGIEGVLVSQNVTLVKCREI